MYMYMCLLESPFATPTTELDKSLYSPATFWPLDLNYVCKKSDCVNEASIVNGLCRVDKAERATSAFDKLARVLLSDCITQFHILLESVYPMPELAHESIHKTVQGYTFLCPYVPLCEAIDFPYTRQIA